ncbi:hypothetical protein GMA19_00254 [Paenibacillus polymyxa E681]|nr:hypothetical protein GE561_00254 [Paenibacillus polymyxa E681]QNV59969.1 hypothetical protein GMA19_00254 [Paenibacillus polymyxa E681]
MRHLYLNRNIACMIVISLIANMSGNMTIPFFCHLCREPWIVYLAMFIRGIGGASYLDSFYSQLGDVIPEENRSSFIGNVVSLS